MKTDKWVFEMPPPPENPFEWEVFIYPDPDLFFWVKIIGAPNINPGNAARRLRETATGRMAKWNVN